MDGGGSDGSCGCGTVRSWRARDWGFGVLLYAAARWVLGGPGREMVIFQVAVFAGRWLLG